MATQVRALPRTRSTHVPARADGRVLVVDSLRGLALLAMALDHAAFFVGTSLQAESYGGAAVALQSWPYWLAGLATNIAAPLFWLLSGVSLALYEAGRRRRGEADGPISHFILVRAGALLALDLTVCALAWRGAYPYVHVLTSMALAMIVLAGLRRLPTAAMLLVGLGSLFGYQSWLLAIGPTMPEMSNLFEAVLLGYSYSTRPAIGFALLGWGPLMWLGFCIGRVISKPWQRPGPGMLLLIGLALIGAALCLRLVGGYGDFGPFGQIGASPAHWLIMSKAPASLSFLAFNLGLASLLAAGMSLRPDWLTDGPLSWLVGIGQASLAFYVAHLWVYNLIAAVIVPLELPLNALLRGCLAFALGLPLLLPFCGAYRQMRQRNRDSVLRYL